MWKFEESYLEKINPLFNFYHTAQDELEEITPYQRPRGFGGCGILFRKDIQARKISTSSNRVCGAIMHLGETPTLVLSVYMPTQGTYDVHAYNEEIDILEALLEEHAELDLIILGDMNASITRPRPSLVDKALVSFITKNHLKSDDVSQHTFHHHNQIASSKIDYILFKDNNRLQPTNFQLIRSPANTSSHQTISASLQLMRVGCRKTHKPLKPAKKVQLWSKLDTRKYRDALIMFFDQSDFCKTATTAFEAAEATATVCAAFKYAEGKAVPEKTVKLKGRSYKLPPDVVKLLHHKKKIHAKLKEEKDPVRARTLKLDRSKARKEIRSAMRRARARERDKLYNSLMSKPNDKTFHRMISFQRKGKGAEVDEIIDANGEALSDPAAQRKALSDHYAKLASLSQNADFDDSYLDACRSSLLFAEEPELNPSSENLFERCIDKLNKNKAADLAGLRAEHLKACPRESAKMIAYVDKAVKASTMLPSALSTGLVTSIPKKDKDSRYPANHRGITITSIIGKAIEHAEVSKVSRVIWSKQSHLQFGFTPSLSPLGASVIITEAVAQSHRSKLPLYIATLDAQKAFDTVSHEVLLHTLTSSGNLESLQAATKLLYAGLTSKVKWDDDYGDSFPIQQGVRQGGVLSTHLYKLYINGLLKELHRSNVGFKMGVHYFGSPTCADDVVLLANSPEDLQAQLNVVHRFAAERRYSINASKSGLLISGYVRNASKDSRWNMGGTEIPVLKELTHLGLTRVEDGSATSLVEARIRKGRRTLYALIGTGVHGSNGIGVDKCLSVYLAYVLPVVTYGLESLYLSAKDEQTLERFHSQMVKHLQGISIRTATCGAYLLAGILPIKALLDRARLSLLRCMIAASEKPEIRFLLIHGTASDVPKSWTGSITQSLATYDLPLLQDLLDHPPSKPHWKARVDRAVNTYWISKLQAEQKTKKTLCRLRPTDDGSRHPIWTTVRGCQAVREATIKARMLLGAYLLQSHRARFNQCDVDATCMLCREADEDLVHFLAVCPLHQRTRQFHLQRLIDVTQRLNVTPLITPTNAERFTQAVLDFRLLIPQQSQSGASTMEDEAVYEAVTRHFCYEMHCSRLRQVGKLEPRRRKRAATTRVAIRAEPIGGGSLPGGSLLR